MCQIKVVFFILIMYGIVAFTLTVLFLKESEAAYAIFYGMYVVETAIPPLIPTGKEAHEWKKIGSLPKTSGKSF